MNALDLWFECRRSGITLHSHNEKIQYGGPSKAVNPLLSAMKANRDALHDCVVALDRALFADGPYLPWGPRLTSSVLREWQTELFAVIEELARLEGWPDDHYDLIVGAIDRQPVSTLRPDLAHFTVRLAAARRSSKPIG